MSGRRFCHLVGSLLVGLLAAAAPAGAQDASERMFGRPVTRITFEIEGRPAPSPSPSLEALVVQRPGAPLRSELLRESIVHLINAGRLDDVQVVGTETPAGIELLFKLTPRHPIDRLQFTGDPGLSESDLQRLVRDRFGGLPSREQPANVARAVTVILNDEGFPSARVTFRVEETHNPDRASLVLDVQAGRRAVVASSEVVSATPLPAGMTPASIIARAAVAPGQPFRRRAIDVALAAILDDLRRRGYYTATALLQGDPDPSAPAGVHVVLRVDAGPLVRLRWDFPKPPGDEENFVPMRRQRSADADLLEDADRAVESYWRRQGYKNAKVSHTSESQGDSLIITIHTTLGPRYRIEALKITGNAHIPEQTIQEALALRPGDWFDESRVLSGMVQMRLMYFRRGFYKATVQELEPEEVPDPQTSADVRQVVHIDVTEGPEVHVGAVTVTGVDPSRESEIQKRMRTKSGAPYSREDQLRDKADIDEFYRDIGFENETSGFESHPGAVDGTMDVVVTVGEGPQVIVGDIRVIGYQRSNPEEIISEMSLRRGEPYGESARFESQRRLYNMALFRRVSIDQEPGLGDNLAHIIVTVEELPATSTSYGGGVEGRRQIQTLNDGTVSDRIDFAPRGFFEIGRRNLGGKNRSIDFFTRGTLRKGQQAGDGYGFSEYRVAGTYFEPRAFHSDTNLTGGISSERAVRSTFDFVRQSLNADLLRRISSRGSVSGRYSLEFTRLLRAQVPIDQQPIIDRFFPRVRLSILSNGAVWDSRNDPVDPVRGQVVSADWEFAARRIGSEVGYAKLFLQGTAFHPLSTTRRVVFAGRAEVGIARGFEREVISDGKTSLVADVPASQRFFAGGSTTVRGFQLDRLGAADVLDENGLSKGGNGVVVLNAELRTTIAKLGGKDFGIVGFTDAGNVFAKASHVDFTQLRSAYGFGVRYNSVLGPIRLDFGIKTRRQVIGGRRERGWEYHLNIGEAF